MPQTISNRLNSLIQHKRVQQTIFVFLNPRHVNTTIETTKKGKKKLKTPLTKYRLYTCQANLHQPFSSIMNPWKKSEAHS